LQQIAATSLPAVLPTTGVGVGQAYEPSPSVAPLLLGPSSRATRLVAKLAEVRPAAAGDVPGPGSQVAVLDITAQGQGLRGQIASHAVIDFRFEPTAPGSDGITTAPGFVAKVRLAEESTGIVPSGTERLKRYFRRELVLERRVEDVGEPITLPTSPPSATDESTWLTYNDPAGRYRLRHPQGLRPGEPEDPKRAEVTLTHVDLGQRTFEQIVVTLVPQSELRTIEVMRNAMREAWKTQQVRAEEGQAVMLPAEGWPEGMRVGRIDAVLTQPGADGQGRSTTTSHFLAYTVQTGHPVGLFVKAQTTATDPTALREQVEAIIRTVQIAPGVTVTLPAAAATPSGGEVAVPRPPAGGAGLPPSSPGTP
jgi:hypothetical protein